jgi:hypothetical protein
MPVFAAALNSLTAVGAVPAAGTVSGYVIAFVGFVQVVLTAHVAVTPVTLEADVDRVCTGAPDVNVVEVTVTFQPVPEPVASLTVIGSV